MEEPDESQTHVLILEWEVDQYRNCWRLDKPSSEVRKVKLRT